MQKLSYSVILAALTISSTTYAFEGTQASQSNGKTIEPTLTESFLNKDGSTVDKTLFSQPHATNKEADVTNKKDTDSVIKKLSDIASSTVTKVQDAGLASWYGRQFHGKKTASGEKYDMNGFTAAHRTLPLSCYIKVTNKDNGKSVVVKVNDRGPFHSNRVLDLSFAAAQTLGITGKGTGNVIIERILNTN